MCLIENFGIGYDIIPAYPKNAALIGHVTGLKFLFV